MGDAIRGITSRQQVVWNLFRDLARGDFKHDFGERVAARDLFTANDASRFFEIAKNVSKKGKVFLTQKFLNDAANKTIYELLGGTFDKILPAFPGAALSPGFLSEEQLFERVTGNEFDDVKRALNGTPLEFDLPTGIRRSYTLTSSYYRLSNDRNSPGYKSNRNIAAMFQEVTGKNKFALIIDASGGLPLTEVLNTTLTPPAGVTEFFIIENIENASDSATKLTNIKEKGPPPTPTLRFLRDTANTVVYPIWENSADPKSNIYSALKIVLNRVTDDETEADIEVTTGGSKKIIHIGDVSNSSNVKNASLRAYAELLEKGSAAVDPYVYTLIKRMGDWCQALSLLDLDRQYDILNQSHEPEGKTITLRNMLVDTEVGIVTNDRILLSFCLLHGINVFYTTAMDVAKLIYFKNNNDVPDPAALEGISKKLYDVYAANPYSPKNNQSHMKQVSDKLSKYEGLIKAETDIGNYILQIRSYFSNVGKLRNEFTSLDRQYTENMAIYNNRASTPPNRFNAVNALISLATKQQVDIQHNATTVDDLLAGNFSGMDTDRIRIESLRRKLASGGRITKSVEIVEAKNILLSIRDDINQMRLNGFVPLDRIAALLKVGFRALNERAQPNYDEIMTVIPTIALSLDTRLRVGPQKGGGMEQLPNVFRALRTRSIRIIPADTEEQTSTVNFYKIGDVYYDDKMKPYTVSDEYIVTEDDLPVFDLLFNGFVPAPADDTLTYVCLKYLLLKLDLLSQEFGNLQYEYQEDSSVYEFNTIQYDRLVNVRNSVFTIASTTIPTLITVTGNVYGKNIAAHPIQAGELLTQRIPEAILAARTMLIGAIGLGAATPATQIEQDQTRLLQSIAANAAARSGYLRELIAQKFGLDLRLIVKNVYNQEEGQRLGSVIEYNLLTPSIIPETRDDIDYTAELVRQAVFQWSNGGVPEATLNAIKLFTKQHLTQLRPRIPAGGLRPRRPLYSNDPITPPVRLLTDNDSGLRERSRTRRTRRIQQSTRVSTRRR